MSSDALARERIHNSLDESLIVEAAAGTGKTSELIQRIVNVIKSGRTTVDRIVAVTFTRKAAGELRLRLRIELDRGRIPTASPVELHNLEEALARLEEAHIGTIHGFCAELLHQRPVEAKIPPGFEELDEHQSLRLYNRAFDRWIQDALQAMPPGLRRALTRLGSTGAYDPDGSPLHRLRFAGRALIEWRDYPAEWRRDAFDQAAQVEGLLPEIEEFGKMIATCNNTQNPLRRHLQCVVDFRSRLRRSDDIRHRDYDELEAMLIRLARDLRRYHTKGHRKFSSQYTRDDIVDAMNRLLSNLNQFERHAGAELAALLQVEMGGVVETYEQMKTGAGKLDFVDLLIRTRNLLREDAAVRKFMQQRFTHLFIDEFQDTDPIQAEILMLLSADDPEQTDWREIKPRPGALFMVGDPKQSIYRFRRADIIMYQDLCRRLEHKGVGCLFLSSSYRSLPSIQECINAAFAPEMKGDAAAGQPSYVPLEACEQAAVPEQPSVIALPAPRPYGVYRISNDAIEACLPETVGSFIDWLIHESNWKVRDPLARHSFAKDTNNSLVPIKSHHIAILFRRFMSFRQDMTRDYVHALEVRNIPHVLWGARSFHQREEVETVRSALNAIEWPDDELSVYATLRGSLFAIPDNVLIRQFAKKDGEPVASAMALLRDLHRRRNWRSPVETISELLESTRAHAGFALRPGGSQVLANVYRICDLARAYELSDGFSFRGFVEHLNAQAESEDTSEAPVLEDGAEGVRVMTVHAAKGLEFPIVILADMTANIATRSPDKHVDGDRRLCATRILNCSPWDLLDHEQEEHARDEAEGVRVAYVAATRARDLLVVCAVGDEEREGWLKPLNRALYPKRQDWRNAVGAPLCPAFGNTTVLKRPVEFDGSQESSVHPGLHQPEQGSHSVLWWDPALLQLNVEPSFGLRQQDVLRDTPAKRAEDSVAAYQSWQDSRRSVLAEGAKPSIELFVATDGLQEPPPGYAEAVRVTRVGRKYSRSRGRRFGSLVHLILRDVAYDAAPAVVEHIAATHGRLTDASDEEIAAAAEAVSGCLKHPLLDLAANATSVFRELPIVLRTESGGLLEAVVDLAFESPSGWTVVDFKTDAEDPVHLLKYRRQVGWYVWGLETIQRKRPVGWLLHV